MKYGMERGIWQEIFINFLDDIGLSSYGYIEDDALKEFETPRGGFENNVFLVNPFFWGDDELTEEEEREIANQPNFIFKPLGFMIDWYKYPLRGATCNQSISLDAFKDILEKCKASVQGCDYCICENHTINTEDIGEYDYNVIHDNERLALKGDEKEFLLDIYKKLGEDDFNRLFEVYTQYCPNELMFKTTNCTETENDCDTCWIDSIKRELE